MYLKKVFLLINMIIVLSSSVLCAQGSPSAELICLLNNGQYFESRELYQKTFNNIDVETDLYYKFHIAQFENKIDSAAIYLEKITIEYPDEFGDGIIDVYATLSTLYYNLKEYSKSLYFCERMKLYLKDNSHNTNKDSLEVWKEKIEEHLSSLEQLKKQPPIRLNRKATNNSAKIEEDTKLLLEVKYNGVAQRTFFDTGVGFYLMLPKITADKIGIKLKDTFKETSGYLNGIETTGDIIIMDSIEIGNITLYNIPTLVYEYDLRSNLPDSIKNDSAIMTRYNSANSSLMNPIIGLPSMLMIGKFKIDWKNKKMTFPKDYTATKSKGNNLFLYNNNVYTHLKINKIPFTTLLDSGSEDYIEIDNLFYQKYPDEIPVNATTIKEKTTYALINRPYIDVSYKIVNKAIISFNEKVIIHSKKRDKITISPMRSDWPMEIFDGVIGCNFLRNIGEKVLLDFDNMRLEAIK